MNEHKMYAHGQRTVDVRLDIGEDGITNEEVTNVGAPAPINETYSCECGAEFEDFADAKSHILELAEKQKA